MKFERDNIRFLVMVNDEEQYSIWPQSKTVPQGWKEVGVAGNRKACLAYIEKTWVDVRPLSLRRSTATAPGT